MLPLPWVGIGFVVLLLTAKIANYDLLADPIGWLLVLHGLAELPLAPSARSRLRAVAILALVVSVLTWPAPAVAWLERTDDSLPWAVSLPEVAVAVLLCSELAGLAKSSSDIRSARWLELARTVTLVAGVMPVLVLGGRLHSLAVPAALVAVVAPVMLIVLLFRYAKRPWAAAEPASSLNEPDPTEEPDPTH